jgi:hypothetical protein
MSIASDSGFDFKSAVKRQFAARPTLREVLGEQVLALLVTQYPLLAQVSPPLASAQALVLLVPDPGGTFWHRKPLLDFLLQALLEGERPEMAPVNGRSFAITLAEPYRFPGAEDAFEYMTLTEQATGLGELLEALPAFWCEAQADFWRGNGEAGVSRDAWLQLLLKMALLANLPLQHLDDPQRACIQALLAGGSQQPPVFAVEVQLDDLQLMLPGLLVVGEWDERQVFLWCLPSSVVRAFDDIDDFAMALREDLAVHHDFAALTWHRQQLEGDVFAQQAALLLNDMLSRAQRVRYTQLADTVELEQLFAALGEPGQWFIEGYSIESEGGQGIPLGVRKASASDSFAYQQAFFELALAQAQAKGETAQDGVLDLHAYTRSKLRETLLQDYPVEANYQPDDLILELKLARGIPGGAAAGAGGGEPWVSAGERTLTAFAIGNLSALSGAEIASIRHRSGQLIMPWMTADYLKGVVRRVDIGRHYPDYVARSMDDPAQRPRRVERFAREWRQDLLFRALSARLDGRLSEKGLTVVTDYCRGHNTQVPAAALIPLAFTTAGCASRYDVVHGMYVLFCVEPSAVLLYRPLYGLEALKEFESLQALKVHIDGSPELRDAILQWMSPQARDFYHRDLSADTRLVSVGIDPGLLPEPAQLAVRLWRIDVDEKLYTANRDWLVEIAQRDSISNAESRWTMLGQAAWLLFQTATPLLRGPVALVAWLAQAVMAMKNDVQALREGSEFERSQAVVDIVLNIGMSLLHSRLPKGQDASPEAGTQIVQAPSIMGSRPAASVVQGRVGMPGTLGGGLLDFSWRGRQGFNWLAPAQREALRSMSSDVDLGGRQPLSEGWTNGLYLVEGHHYMSMAGDVYRVRQLEGVVQITDSQGTAGPKVTFEQGAWRVDSALRLQGGGPKSRVELKRAENQRKLLELSRQEGELIRALNALGDEFNRHREYLNRVTADLKDLEIEREPGDRDLLNVQRLQFQARLRVVGDLKRLIEKGMRHDDVVSQIAPLKPIDPKMPEAIKLQRNDTRQELISRCEIYYNELAALINEARLGELADSMAALPESESEKQQYRAFYDKLEQVVAWSADLVNLSRDFDVLLEETLHDKTIVFRGEGEPEGGGKQALLNAIIEQRRLSAVDLVFRQLTDLAEASLDRLASVEESTLVEYEEYLCGAELRSAGTAHGDLAGSEWSTAERIKVLNDALDSYVQAQVMSEYLMSLGGNAIRATRLKDYQQVLDGLIRAARAELEQDIREQELAEPRPRRPMLYAMRGGRRRVVTTRRGKSVIGEQRQVNGEEVIQQLDTNGAVLKSFRYRDGEVVEDVLPDDGAPASPVIDSGALVGKARKLVKETESVAGLARRYVNTDEPTGLSTIIDGHIDKLREVTGKLPRTETNAALLESLDASTRRLRSLRSDLLTALYLSTRHPNAESLRFLLSRGQVSVSRVRERKLLQPGDYLDVYQIRRLPEPGETLGDGLWEAHFHYTQADTPRRAFSKGHLKLWTERKLGREAQLRAAIERNELLSIYRGNVSLAQVEGLIPFD